MKVTETNSNRQRIRIPEDVLRRCTITHIKGDSTTPGEIRIVFIGINGEERILSHITYPNNSRGLEHDWRELCAIQKSIGEPPKNFKDSKDKKRE